MQVPLEIVFEDIDPSDAIEARLRDEADKLESTLRYLGVEVDDALEIAEHIEI